jgi:hypothetical protein
MKTTCITTIALLALSASATAQNQDDWRSWPLADRFTVSVDAFFQSLNTEIRLDASDGSPGTTIDFEQNLGMSDTETLPGLGLGWRFAKKHQLQLETFDLNRSGSAVSATDIRFGDEVFTVNLPISSFFDINVVALNYSYSMIFDEKKELAIGVGLSVQDIKFGLVGNAGAGIIESDSGLTAPLPTFGLRGGYAFTDKWIGRAGIGVFSLDLAISDEEQLNGEVVTAYASIQHKTFERIFFGLSYAYFDVGVDFSENGLVNSINYKYQGPVLTVTAAF